MSQENLLLSSPCQNQIIPEFSPSFPDFLTGSPFSDLETKFQLERESIDGRESLGILQLSAILQLDDSKIPDILVTINESASESTQILNTAFLNENLIPRNSLIPSVSSQCSSNSSFHSYSLEGPSKIYTVSSVFNELETKNTFTTLSSGSLSSVLNKGRIITPSELECRVRIRSLPENFDKDCSEADNNIKIQHATFSGTTTVDVEDKNDVLTDFALIEGNYIAGKIANGSILDEPCNIEVGVLDSTPAPNWADYTEPENSTDQSDKNSKENIPPQNETFNDSDNPTSSVANTTEQLKTAKEMIQNLSEILNSTAHSDRQKREGEFLLNSFANLLCTGSLSDCGNLIDSGHSSSINQSLDLSRKSIKVGGNDKSVRKLAISNSTINTSKNKTANSDCSIKSKSANSSGLMLSKVNIKLKTNLRNKSTNKGPLKAVLPIKEIQKRSLKTPERSNSEDINGYQSKKTSTPISEPKLNPIASSTPTLLTKPSIDKSSQTSGRKSLSASTEIKSQIAVKSRRSLPSSLPQFKNTSNSNHSADEDRCIKPKTPKPLSNCNKDKTASGALSRRSLTHFGYKDMRRNSLTKMEAEEIQGRRRSNSLGEASGLMSSLSKIRENLKNSPEFKKLKCNTLKERNGNINNPFKKATSKNSYQMSKSLGKENVAK